MKITYWSDFACPWCWIGEENLRTAIRRIGRPAEFEMKAYQLQPEGPKEGGMRVEESFIARGYSEDEAIARASSVDYAAKAAGLPFDYAKAIRSNTFDAHRLRKFALDKFGVETAEKLDTVLFTAYFSKHLVLGDTAVLAHLAEEAGIPEAEAEKVLSSNDYASEVEADEEEAAMHRVSSVPYFVVNGKYAVPGAVGADDWEKGLRSVYKEEDEEKAGPFGAADASACGPDGCDLEAHRKGASK